MQRLLGVFNSSSVNRYGYKFPAETLFSALEQSWEMGIPSFLSHDYHRPIGWSKGLSLYIEPGLTRSVGETLIPENDTDSKEILSAINCHTIKKLSDMFEPHRFSLEEKLNGYLTENAGAHFPCSASFIDDNLAVRVFPHIFDKQDKAGLVPLSILKSIAPGVFEVDGLLLYAHQFFRRSFSRLNNLNYQFLTSFQELASDSGIELRIALDPDMVGLASSYIDQLELEYWRGPKFVDNLEEIPFGVTVHGSKTNEKIFHGILKTEFWWHNQNNLKTLECEEIRENFSKGTGEDTFGCRYCHCILNSLEAGNKLHFDGAVRVYSMDKMLDRIDTDISKSGKNTDYVKLWRLDGQIEVSVWKTLLSNYYRDNTLVGEYLGGEFDGILSSKLVEHETINPINNYIPVTLSEGDGPRLSVSLQSVISRNINCRFVESFDTLQQDTSKFNYIDSDSIEIFKIIKRNGGTISVPDSYDYIAFDDLLLNLPLIQHVGPEAISLADQTHDAIIEFCKACSKYEDNRLLSYTIGIQYEDKNVWFSVAGHVTDLTLWYSTSNYQLPRNYSEVGVWCSTVEEELAKIFSHKPDIPDLHSFLKTTGMLVFPRIYIDPEQYKFSYDHERSAWIANLMIKKTDLELIELVKNRELKVATSVLRRKSECSKCGTDYFDCYCSKLVDRDTCEVFSDGQFLGPFWTSMKA